MRIPFIDLNRDDHTSFMIRSKNENIDSSVRTLRTRVQAVDYPNNIHPNADAYLYQSYFVEECLRSI